MHPSPEKLQWTFDENDKVLECELARGELAVSCRDPINIWGKKDEEAES